MSFWRRMAWLRAGHLMDEGLGSDAAHPLGEGMTLPAWVEAGPRLDERLGPPPTWLEAGALDQPAVTPLLRAEGLTKRYGPDVTALRDAALTIGRGEFLAIMGRSGSGKSTLLHLLGCLDRPTSGAVWFDGVEVTRLPERHLPPFRLQKLGFVFQAHNLVPTLTALENVTLPLRYTRTAPTAAIDRARSALAAVGLTDRLHHRPSELSGGQQQRVAIARALVNNPALVLADEPTGALDSATASELLALLRHLCRERGQTFVLVTHDPLVGNRCDRVIQMADGRILS